MQSLEVYYNFLTELPESLSNLKHLRKLSIYSNPLGGIPVVEFADLTISLGIYQGLNLGGGGSTTLIIKGKVVNLPSDRTGERPVGNCILLLSPRLAKMSSE